MVIILSIILHVFIATLGVSCIAAGAVNFNKFEELELSEGQLAFGLIVFWILFWEIIAIIYLIKMLPPTYKVAKHLIKTTLVSEKKLQENREILQIISELDRELYIKK